MDLEPLLGIVKEARKRHDEGVALIHHKARKAAEAQAPTLFERKEAVKTQLRRTAGRETGDSTSLQRGCF